MTYRPSTATGRVPAYLSGPGPDKELETAVSSLTDSITGLRRASSLVKDQMLSVALTDMAKHREEARSAILVATFEAGVQLTGDLSGTASGALRRGWMRLESALAGDDPVFELIQAEDKRLSRELGRVLRRNLPTSVSGAVRNAQEVVQEGTAHLRRLKG